MIIFSDDAVSVNLEGVALIVLVGLGLMFALMTCVFYDHVLSKLFTSCKKTAMKSYRENRDKAMDAMSKKKKKETEETKDPEEDEEASKNTTNTFLEQNAFLNPPQEKAAPEKKQMGNGISTSPRNPSRTLTNKTKNVRFDKTTTSGRKTPIDEDEIRDILERRPHLMKNMKPSKDVPHRSGTPHNNAYFNDNFGFEDDVYDNRGMYGSSGYQEPPRYSRHDGRHVNGGRRVEYEDERDFYFKEREAIVNRGRRY